MLDKNNLKTRRNNTIFEIKIQLFRRIEEVTTYQITC